jgi:hypothetical protein
MYGQQSEEIMESHTKKKVWLALSSKASIAVLSVSSIIITIILLGGVNPLFASSSFQMPGMMGKNMGMQNMTNQMPGMMGKNMGMRNMTNQMPGMMGKNMTVMQNAMTVMAKNMTVMQNAMTMMAKQMMHHHLAAIGSGKRG